jgi:mannan endo-1,4-beta-mannosidase
MRPPSWTQGTMRPRLVMLLSFAVAAIAIAFTGARFTIIPSPAPPAHSSLPSQAASYLGVFEKGTTPSEQQVAEFGKVAGKLPNLVGYYSGWSEQFQLSFAQRVFSQGETPYVQIDPTFASVSGIAAGVYDKYLITYADSVRDFKHSVVIGFGHEMNDRKYLWGYGHVPAQTFVAAWRHIVTLFRDQGAENVTWLWTVQAETPQTGPIATWWPGKSYVTWVGIDGYYTRQTDTFNSVFGQTIKDVQGLTSRPILLSETAVGPTANQSTKILNLFSGLRQNRMLGLVWFDIEQHGSPVHQNWRIENSSHAAEVEFQLGVSEMTLVSAADRH